MFETEGSNLRFKFVDGTLSEEDIMFLSAVCINVFCCGAVYTGLYGQVRHSEGNCWMSESPAVLALTCGGM